MSFQRNSPNWQATLQAIASRASDADRAGIFPMQDAIALRESGVLALSVPCEFGGQGGNLLLATHAILDLAQASAAAALLTAMTLHAIGNAAERNNWLPGKLEQLARAVISGKIINSLASEPQLGSPSRGGLPVTSLTALGTGKYRLDGHKNWATGGIHLDYLLVRARLQEESVVVLVPNNAPGIRWENSWQNALSLRASDSHDVYFNVVELPADAILSADSHAAKAPNGWFTGLMSAVYFGVGLAAFHQICDYAKTRVPTALGKPIASLPNIQRQIGEMRVSLSAAQLLLLQAAENWTGKHPQQEYPQIVSAKHLAVETAMRVTESALRIAGGASVASDLPFERYFRDARAGLMHPPSGDQALEYVGKAALESQ